MSNRIAWLLAVIVCMMTGQRASLAVSQHAPPKNNYINLSENPAKTSAQYNDQIYVYTLSSFTGPKKNIRFNISQSRIDHMSPLIFFNMYHDIDSFIHPELVDHTIWGILGSYFDKSIGEIATENEIQSFFEKIKDINEKYKALVDADDPERFDIDRVITASQTRFRAAHQQLHREAMRQYAINTKWRQDTQRMSLSSASANTKTSASGASGKHGEGNGPQSVSSDKKNTPQGAYSNQNSHFIFKIFHMIRTCISYTFTHKIESSIYILSTLLALFFAKQTIFGR